MDIDPDQVARRISALLKQMQLTQKQFAEKLEVTQPAISKYMQGRIPPCAVLLRLARLSGTSMEWLLTGQEPLPAYNAVAENQAAYGQTILLEERMKRLPLPLRRHLYGLIDVLLQELKY